MMYIELITQPVKSGCYAENMLISLRPSKFERQHDILYIEHKPPKPITISKPTLSKSKHVQQNKYIPTKKKSHTDFSHLITYSLPSILRRRDVQKPHVIWTVSCADGCSELCSLHNWRY